MRSLFNREVTISRAKVFGPIVFRSSPNRVASGSFPMHEFLKFLSPGGARDIITSSFTNGQLRSSRQLTYRIERQGFLPSQPKQIRSLGILGGGVGHGVGIPIFKYMMVTGSGQWQCSGWRDGRYNTCSQLDLGLFC
eukprot:scaffold16213_cov106-Skeletonema_marinoi.AAC.3